MKISLVSILPSVSFFLGVLIIILTFYIKLKKGNKTRDRKWTTFLEEEAKAASYISKSFPSSLVWTIDFNKIPVVTDSSCQIAYQKLAIYQNCELADLRAYSNLELKKQFGINHLNTLTAAEQRYFESMHALVKYGVALKERHYIAEAIATLEYALEKRCDQKDCYLSLIEMYVIIKDKQKLLVLKDALRLYANDLVYFKMIDRALDEALLNL